MAARFTEYLSIHFASLASIAIRAASVGAGFFVAFYIGHYFGPMANGQYALIAQTAMFLSIVAVGGMDLAVVRRFSAAAAYHVPLAPAALLRALGYSLGVALLIALLLQLAGPHMVRTLFHGSIATAGLVILAILLFARTTTRLTAAVLRSQECHFTAQTIEVLAIPGLVASLLALGAIHTLDQVLTATAAVGLGAAAYGIWRSWRFVGVGENALDVTFAALFRTSLPLWGNAIALNIADWYSLATAAAALGVYQAGLFRVSFQIASALSFSAMGVYNVFTARISGAVALGDVHRVARLGRSGTRLAVALVTPAVIVLLLFGRPLLGLIGSEFEQAVPLLTVMVIGQAIYVATGPSGLVLAMSGHERLNFAISAAVTGSLLIVAPIAAHMYGLFGLAVATSLVPVIGNIANFVAVYRLEKINVLTGRYFGPEPADAPALDAVGAPPDPRG